MNKREHRQRRNIAHALRGTTITLLLAGSGFAWSKAQIAVTNQGYVPFSDAPINYRTTPLTDPIAKLQQRLDAGKTKLVIDVTANGGGFVVAGYELFIQVRQGYSP